mgnify:CR=1 FL=1
MPYARGMAGEQRSTDGTRKFLFTMADGQSIDNQMRIGPDVQVGLKVRIAEISRNVTRALGINWQAVGKLTGSWRIDAWGEPLSGGASIVFQAGTDAAPATELLCMNVVGRLRRIRGNSCSD